MINISTLLPINLQSFTANLIGKTIQLNWQTAAEENTQNFTLKRSTDGGRTFTAIGSVPALDRREGAAYTFLDENLAGLNGPLYYQLIARDFDGAQEVFGPVMVILPGGVEILQAIPNPSTAAASVRIMGADAGAKVALFSMDGRHVVTLESADDGATRFLLPQLAPGVYLLRSTSPTGVRKTARMVIR
jgi:hypothetical protein